MSLGLFAVHFCYALGRLLSVCVCVSVSGLIV